MKENFKYSLDKSNRKFICPNCNKRTFVKFVDNETNEYLNIVNGRCDRESKCSYFKKPSNNFMAINKNFITDVIQHSYHNEIVLKQFSNYNQQSNFISYLLKLFNPKVVLQAVNMYHIGTTNYWKNATVFWQIDLKNVIRGGKIMLYNSDTGKRIKTPFNHVSWIHKQLKKNNFVLQQCLFGMHNINNISRYDTICIVESEKTAIIMSIVIPDFLWLATGSQSGFKEEMLQPIRDYNIIAYPDKTEFDRWTKIANRLNDKGFNIQCSSILERVKLEKGDDLIDFLLKSNLFS